MATKAEWWDIRFRIDNYNHLIKQNNDALCKITGWPLVTTLDMTLHKLCCLIDDHWVLAVLELKGFPDREAADVALTSKEIIIKQYSKTNTIGPFVLMINGRRSFKFALLINSYPNLNQSKSIMNDFGEKILSNIIESYYWRRRDDVSKSIKCKIGIGKMNLDQKYCNWVEWKQRVFGYVDNFNNCSDNEKKLHLYCDIDHELTSRDGKNKGVNIGDSDDNKDAEKNKENAKTKTIYNYPSAHVTTTMVETPTKQLQIDFGAKNVSTMKNLVNQTLLNGKIIDVASSQQLYPSWNQRRDIAKIMITTAKRRDCETREIQESRRELLKTSNKLDATSQEYIAVENWFVKVYSYLSLLKQKIDDLLSSLVTHFEQYYQCDSIKIGQFDILFCIYQYLDHVGDLLTLFYTCYNWHFVSIFYPFIKQAIGKKQCDLLFCSHKDTQNNCNSNNCSISTILAKLICNDVFLKVQHHQLMKVNRSVYFVEELFYNVNDMTTTQPVWLPPDIDNSKYELTFCDLYNYTRSKLKEALNRLILNQQKLFYYDDKINIDAKSIHLHSYRESMVPNFVRLFVLNRILLLEPNINGSMLTQQANN